MSDLRQDGFTIGTWQVSPQTGELKGDGGELRHLEPKVVDVLVCLARQPGVLVSRDEIIASVWNGTAATDEPLTRVIAALRRELDDDRGNPTYIETIPKRGYRLIAELKPLHDPVSPSSSPAAGSYKKTAIAASLLAGIIAVAWLFGVVERNRGPLTVDAAAANSVAVLPFRNRSALVEDARFAEGLRIDIITQLSNLSFLEKVISHTSLERYRDSQKPVAEIGRELDVTTVLEGTIQRAGSRIRLNLLLVEAATEKHLWAESFDRELTTSNLFAIQNEISAAIAGALQETMSSGDGAQLAQFPTDDIEAYESYVLGREALKTRTVADLEIARGHFEKAIEFDPEFALAYAGLGDALNLLVLYGGLSEDAYAEAEKAIATAINLDLTVGEAHAALGYLRWRYSRFGEIPFEFSEDSFRTALRLSPNYAPAYQWYGLLLLDMQRFDDAARQMQQAIALDPFNSLLHSNLGDIYAWTGSKEAAVGSYSRALELQPDLTSAMNGLGSLYLFSGDPVNSLVWYEKTLAVDPQNVHAIARHISAYLAVDSIDNAEHWYSRLADTPRTFWQPVYDIIMSMCREDRLAAIEAAQTWLTENPRCIFCLEVVSWDMTDTGRDREAIDLLLHFEPGLIESPEATVDRRSLYLVAPLARALINSGRAAEASALLAAGLQVAADTPRLVSGLRGTGIEDVRMLVLLGRHEEALARLEEAVDQGWVFKHGPIDYRALDVLKTKPGYSELLARLATDARDRRQQLTNLTIEGSLSQP